MIEARANIEIPIYYHPGQKKVFFDCQAKRRIVVKGRRWGLTRGMANLAIELLLDGVSPGLWVDTVNSNIDRYVERYFFPILRYLPPSLWIWRQQKKELEINGHKLDLRSADRPELIEGFAYRFIFLNEAGIILRDEYLWHNTIQPMMLDYDPLVIIGGTPKGSGLFKLLADQAQEGKNGWAYFHFTSFDNPYLTKSQIDELMEDMPESVAKQEIYAEFISDASRVFKKVEKAIGAKPEPKKPDKTYYAGIDLARLKDYTVVIILDQNGNQVYMDRFNLIDWAIQRERIAQALRDYRAYALIDSTGVGDPIYEDLRNMGLSIEGYKLTNETKRHIIQSLMVAFETEKIKIFDDKILVNELNNFECEITESGLIRYSAPEGYHDDCVIALALANYARQKYAGLGPIIWRPE
jgi:hypothetical protein